jgi:uncharacterized caspase-like protein
MNVLPNDCTWLAARCTLLAASLAWPGAALAANGQMVALVIGVNDCPQYVLADGTRPRALQGAEADAAAVAELLEKRYGVAPERMMVLLGDKARLADVEAALERLRRVARPEDTLVFYFAGHGTQVKDVRPLDEEDRLDEALCLADSTARGERLLRDDQLGRWLEDFPAGRVTAILDCCHAGTGIKDPLDEIIPRFLPAVDEAAVPRADPAPWLDLQSSAKSADKRIAALFACQPNQRAYERRIPGQTTGKRRGQFTAWLLDALAGLAADADRDGQLTHAEALAHAARRLNETFNAGRERDADRQSPLLSGQADGPIFWMAPARR